MDFSSVTLRNWSRIDHEQKRVNILILGNDSSINSVNWKSINVDVEKGQRIVTAGVNRIYKHYMPNVFLFIDCDIAQELKQNGITNYQNESSWLVCDYIFNCNRCEGACPLRNEKGWFVENHVILFPESIIAFKKRSSVLWLIKILNDHVFLDYQCYFYIYGVSLNVSKGHFWKSNSFVVRNHAPSDKKLSGYFHSQLNGFCMLLQSGYNLISLTPDSKLNDFMPFINVPLESFVKGFQ